MLYALICTDKKDEGLPLRQENRREHLQYLSDLGEKMVLAGPFLCDQGRPMGSLVVIEAETMEGAEKIAANDPYAKAGVFEKVEIRAWNWLFGRPGGMQF